jgi:hypothetical protein
VARRSGPREAGGSLPRRDGQVWAASSPDNDGTGQYCQMVRVRQARREGVREKPAVERSSRESTSSNLADLGWAAARICVSARRTPGLVSVVGPEATRKACGVLVARLQGHSWSPNRRAVQSERGNHPSGPLTGQHDAGWREGASSADAAGVGRRTRSSRRSNDRPRRAGKPSTGQYVARNILDLYVALRNMLRMGSQARWAPTACVLHAPCAKRGDFDHWVVSAHIFGSLGIDVVKKRRRCPLGCGASRLPEARRPRRPGWVSPASMPASDDLTQATSLRHKHRRGCGRLSNTSRGRNPLLRSPIRLSPSPHRCQETHIFGISMDDRR